MRAGRLRTRVVIQQATETRDDVGEVDKTWSDLDRRYAQIEQPGGSESIRGRQLASIVTDVVTMRFVPNILPKMRLLVGRRILEILFAVDPDGRQRELVLDCQEVQ